MRAAGWAAGRDINAAKTNWVQARQIADQLPTDDPNRLAMQIAPRTLLCGNAWRLGGTVADTGFDELRELCSAAGDTLSLTIGMCGLLTALTFNDRIAESSQLATECVTLIESIGDPVLMVALMIGPLQAKLVAGEVMETLRLAQRVIDLADGDASMGSLVVGSPLAVAQMYRGSARMALGLPGFREDWDKAIETSRSVDPTVFVTGVLFKYMPIVLGALRADVTALRATADALAVAEQTGDRFALNSARLARGIVLLYRDVPDYEAGFELLAQVRETGLAHQFTLTAVRIADIALAHTKHDMHDLAAAIDLSRATVAHASAVGDLTWLGPVTGTLVESLLLRDTAGDIAEAQAAIDTLAELPSDPGFVLHELHLMRMRALLARARGDEDGYRDNRDRYRKMATDLGFEGHMQWAEAMP